MNRRNFFTWLFTAIAAWFAKPIVGKELPSLELSPCRLGTTSYEVESFRKQTEMVSRFFLTKYPDELVSYSCSKTVFLDENCRVAYRTVGRIEARLVCVVRETMEGVIADNPPRPGFTRQLDQFWELDMKKVCFEIVDREKAAA